MTPEGRVRYLVKMAEKHHATLSFEFEDLEEDPAAGVTVTFDHPGGFRIRRATLAQATEAALPFASRIE